MYHLKFVFASCQKLFSHSLKMLNSIYNIVSYFSFLSPHSFPLFSMMYFEICLLRSWPFDPLALASASLNNLLAAACFGVADLACFTLATSFVLAYL